MTSKPTSMNVAFTPGTDESPWKTAVWKVVVLLPMYATPYSLPPDPLEPDRDPDEPHPVSVAARPPTAASVTA
ncbi:hypothetical protein ACRAWF_32935 [Streptomyces sp. L7]